MPDPYDFECPRCGAEPRYRCQTATGRTSYEYHQARAEVACGWRTATVTIDRELNVEAWLDDEGSRKAEVHEIGATLQKWADRSAQAIAEADA